MNPCLSARVRDTLAAFACGVSLLVGVFARADVVPSVFPAVDERGVDVATGAFVHAHTDVVIGQAGAGGLAYSRYYQSSPHAFWTHSHNGYVFGTGTTCGVVLAARIETFTSSMNDCQGTFTSQQQLGSTLVRSGSNFTYTMSDGTIASFTVLGAYVAVLNMNAGGVRGYLTTVTAPTGDVTSYGYEWESFCYPDPFNCYLIYQTGRLQTVYNNAGYRLWFNYPGVPTAWVQPNKVTGINNAVEYCIPPSCSQAWPSATFTYNSFGHVTAATNALGYAMTYVYSGSGTPTLLAEVQFPDNASHDINITYTSGKVTTLDLGYGQWTYGYSDAAGKRTTSVTRLGSFTRTYESTISSGRVTKATNEASASVVYTYDSANRRTRVTLPEGNYTQYSYDGRGNITQELHVAKPSSGLSNIVTTAAYPATCSNAKTCNKPTSTTDARGFRTDYTYNSTHGGVLTITAPALSGSTPVGSGDRPQTRITYAQFQARYLTSSGWTNGTAVWRATVESACSVGTSPSCLNTANETRVTTSYPGSGVANNVLPTTVVTASGDGLVSSTSLVTYTNWGDVETIDGPLSGTADTTRIYYDDLRRPTGIVGPDPDGGGALKYRAVRTTYNSVGQSSIVERGTVTSNGASAFSTFSALSKQETVFDAYARPVQSRAWNGGSIGMLTQYTYQGDGLLSCAAVRMNPSTFSNLPSSACTLATAGSFGADRIVRNYYDNVGRLSYQQSAYGTALSQRTTLYTYTSNGQVATFKNARDYLTTYEYDGFDRLKKTRYPLPTTANQSSTTDYEETTYDAYGRVSQARRRSGDSFTYSWNNLGQVTLSNAPGTQPDVSYDYDLFGREKLTSRPGNILTTTYDALSRVTSVESSVLGIVSYLYDTGGRRTQMTYPGGFHVTYNYFTSGDLKQILENGSTVIAAYDVDDLGRRKSLTRGSLVTSYTYDGLSRLNTLVQNASGTTHDTTFTFGYNPSNQITSRTRTNAAFDWTFPSGFSDSYSANGLDQYTSVDGATPSYDSRGNLTSDGVKTYTYDYDNRVITASGGVALEYDPAGRLHKAQGASTTQFLYDGSDVIAEYNSAGTVLRRYVHGPGFDEPIVWYEGTGTATKKYLMADERGSVIGVTNSSGAVTNVNKYDGYGVPNAGNVGLFQYTGQTWLSDVGLYHYKARAYDPKIGRFLQTDPIGMAGGINLYGYVGNDPANFVDPFGLQDSDTIETPGGACESMCMFLYVESALAATYYQAVTAAALRLINDSDAISPRVPNGEPGWVRTGASVGVGVLPVVGSVQSVVEVFTGRDYIEGTDVNRWIAAAGIPAGVVPGGKALLKGVTKWLGRLLGGGAAATVMTADQAANLSRFIKRLPRGAGEPSVRDLPSGGKVFQAEVPGRVPGSRAIYEKQVDASGTTIQYTKTTYDPAGNIIHIKDKITGSVFP